MSQQNVEAMRGLYDAFNSGDLDAFEKGCAREFMWNEAENSLYSGGNPYRGFVAVRDGVFAPTARDFDGFRVDLDRLIDAGDFIIGSGRYRGRHKVTGKELSAQFCHVLHANRDGKLDGVQEYTDTLQEAEVAGRTTIAEQPALRQPIPA